MNNIYIKHNPKLDLFKLGLGILAVYSCVFSQLYSIFTLSNILETSISAVCLLLLICGRKHSVHKSTFLWLLPLLIIFMNLVVNYSNSLIRECIIWCIGIYMITGVFRVSDYKFFIKLLFVIGIVYALSLIFQYLFPDLYFTYYVPLFKFEYSETISRLWNSLLNIPTGLSHQIGYSLAYVVVSLGLYFFVYRNGVSKGVSILLFIIFLFALLIAKKRMHFASALLCIGLVYTLSASKSQRMSRMILIFTLLIGSVVTALYIFDEYGIGSVFDRYETALEASREGETLSESRVELRQDAITLWKSSPIFGVGWMQFGKQGYEFTTAHNVFLQLLCETGILGTLFFVIPIILSLFKSISLLQHLELFAQWDGSIVQFSTYYQLFFVLYCFTGNPLYDYPYLIPYFFSVASTYYHASTIRNM